MKLRNNGFEIVILNVLNFSLKFKKMINILKINAPFICQIILLQLNMNNTILDIYSVSIKLENMIDLKFI